MAIFSAVDTIGQSWKILKRDWKEIYKVVAVGLAIMIASDIVTRAVEDSSLAFLVGLAVAVVGVLVQMAGIRFFTEVARNNLLKLEDLPAAFQPYSKAVTFVLGQLLVGLIVIVGLILLVIPGIYFAVKYCLVPYLLIDREASVSEALKLSDKYTAGHRWQIVILVLLLFGLNFLGALALMVGLVVTIPLSYIAMGVTYDYLSSKT